MTDKHVEMDDLLRAETAAGIITPEQVRGFIHPRLDLYPASAGTWVHIVRPSERTDYICGVYSTIELARANVHPADGDEIVSYILDARP